MGRLSDLLIVRAETRAKPFPRIVAATERDVELVIIDGLARYVTPALMAAAGASPITPLPVAGRDMLLSLSRPADPAAGWARQDVLDRIEEVRADPAG